MPQYVNRELQRYYRISLERDLLGDWHLIASWSGRDKQAPAGVRRDIVGSEEEGFRRMDRMHKRRLAEGYRLV